MIFTAAVLLRRACRIGLAIAANGADIWYFNRTVVTHIWMLLWGRSLRALILGELSNSWCLELRIGKITSLIVFISTSELPGTIILNTKGTIEHREAHDSLYLLNCISRRISIPLVYCYCLSEGSRIRRACSIGSEVFTLFELFHGQIALRRWNSPLT